MCEVLKQGEQVTCDVNASDLWLQVRILCPAARLELSFEVKVGRTSLIQPVRLGLFDYALHLLHGQGLSEDFQVRDLVLSRVLTGRQQGEEKVLQDDVLISDCFSFVSNQVVGKLEKGAAGTSPTLERVEESTLRQPEEILRKTLSVRKIQTKAMDVPREAKRTPTPARVDTKCLGCLLC